jgi:sulfur-carrier protein
MEIRFYASLRMKAGTESCRIDTAEREITIGDAIRQLDGQLGVPLRAELVDQETNSLREGTLLVLDGVNILGLQGLDTPARGARLDIFPPVGGG